MYHDPNGLAAEALINIGCVMEVANTVAVATSIASMVGDYLENLGGDIIITGKEGYQNTKMALDNILDGKINPIGFDEEKGGLTYNETVDISGYSDF